MDRRNACIPALLRRNDYPDLPIQVRNISCAGLLASIPEQLTVGSYVTLVLTDSRVLLATVRWSDFDQHGLQFARGLSPRQLIELFSGSPTPEPERSPGLLSRLGERFRR